MTKSLIKQQKYNCLTQKIHCETHCTNSGKIADFGKTLKKRGSLTNPVIFVHINKILKISIPRAIGINWNKLGQAGIRYSADEYRVTNTVVTIFTKKHY